MNKRILVIQGHPDPDSTHFGHALADAYVQSARAAGHTVQTVKVAIKALERNILGFVGIAPIRESLVGMVEGDAGKRRDWLARLGKLGAQGA